MHDKYTNRRELLGGLFKIFKGHHAPDSKGPLSGILHSHPEFGPEYILDPESESWKQAYGVDENGKKLTSIHDPACVQITVKAPPSIEAFWNFRRNDWDLPVFGRDIFSRTVLGKTLVTQWFRLTSEHEEARRLRMILKYRFPQVNLENIVTAGWTAATSYCSSDVITLFGYGLPRDFIINYSCPLIAVHYRLKLHVQTGEVYLKLNHPMWAQDELPELPAFVKPQWIGKTYSLDKFVFPIQDIYFYGVDETVADFCFEHELPFPEDLYQVERDVQTFALTFDSRNKKPLKIKRYYMWWPY